MNKEECVTPHVRVSLGGWQVVHDMANAVGLSDCLVKTVDMVNQQSNSMFRLVESNVHAKMQVSGLDLYINFMGQFA